MNFRTLTNAHFQILSLYLETDREYNYKEIKNGTAMSYPTACSATKDLVEMGFLIGTVANRWLLNEDFEGVTLMRRLFKLNYIIPPEKIYNKEIRPKGIYLPPSIDENRGSTFATII